MNRSPAMKKYLDSFTIATWGRVNGQGVCVTCGSDKVKQHDFSDTISQKEFCISGMCQVCQDSVFNPRHDTEEM